MALWIQVRDVEAERRRLLAAGVPAVHGPRQELWGLVEMWIEDPDGVRIVLFQVPHSGCCVPVAVLQLSGQMTPNGPTWYVILQGVIGVAQVLIALAMILAYRRSGVWRLRNCRGS